jgi:hypothetical protein
MLTFIATIECYRVLVGLTLAPVAGCCCQWLLMTAKRSTSGTGAGNELVQSLAVLLYASIWDINSGVCDGQLLQCSVNVSFTTQKE